MRYLSWPLVFCQHSSTVTQLWSQHRLGLTLMSLLGAHPTDLLQKVESHLHMELWSMNQNCATPSTPLPKDSPDFECRLSQSLYCSCSNLVNRQKVEGQHACPCHPQRKNLKRTCHDQILTAVSDLSSWYSMSYVVQRNESWAQHKSSVFMMQHPFLVNVAWAQECGAGPMILSCLFSWTLHSPT